MTFRQRTSAARASEQGFIVLGLLVLVTAVVVTGVLLGKVIHRNRFPPLEVPVAARELRYTLRPVEVRYGPLVARRVEAGEPLWVRPSAPGEVVVFEAAASPKIVGYAPDSLLAQSPRQQRGGRRTSAF